MRHMCGELKESRAQTDSCIDDSAGIMLWCGIAHKPVCTVVQAEPELICSTDWPQIPEILLLPPLGCRDDGYELPNLPLRRKFGVSVWTGKEIWRL